VNVLPARVAAALVRGSVGIIEFAGFAADFTNKIVGTIFIAVNSICFAEFARPDHQNGVFAQENVGSDECNIGSGISLTFRAVLPDRAMMVICELQDDTRAPRWAIVKSANNPRYGQLGPSGWSPAPRCLTSFLRSVCAIRAGFLSGLALFRLPRPSDNVGQYFDSAHTF
jgi:hypothetical protein